MKASFVLKFFGWLFVSVSVLLVALLVDVLIHRSKEDLDALPGILFFLAVALVPAVLLLRKGRTIGLKSELAWYIAASDGFTLADAARRGRQSESVAEKWVLQIAAERRLDLVFDPEGRRFFRRGTTRQVRPADAECPSCGAPLTPLTLAQSETAKCRYCSAPIRVLD